jgi:hypothetical protein
LSYDYCRKREHSNGVVSVGDRVRERIRERTSLLDRWHMNNREGRTLPNLLPDKRRGVIGKDSRIILWLRGQEELAEHPALE